MHILVFFLVSFAKVADYVSYCVIFISIQSTFSIFPVFSYLGCYIVDSNGIKATIKNELASLLRYSLYCYVQVDLSESDVIYILKTFKFLDLVGLVGSSYKILW